jgi:peptide/nickel transport system substrate-binding protein
VDGTGPYKLVEWNKDEDMHLVRFDDYFNGPAATENIVIQIVPEAASRAIAIESHQVDAATGISAEDVLRFEEDETLNVFSIPGPGCHLFQFNCADPIVKDTKVRQAISYALDRESLVETLWGAMGEKPRDSVAPPAAFGYINLGVIQQDQEKAKQLLAEAGYPDGFDMTVMCTDVYNKGVQAGEIVKAQLAEVGINVTLDVIDKSTFNDAWSGLTAEEFNETYGWGMFLMGAGYITLDGDEGLKRRFATSETGVNDNNYGFYSNAEVDELLNGAAATVDQEWREKAYQRAAEILYLEDPVGCYLNSRNETVVLSAKVAEFNMTPVGIYDWPNIKVLAD